MSLNIRYKFSIDNNNDKNTWTMVYMYKPKSTEIFERLGELFGIISIKVEEEFDFKKASHHFLEVFHDSYFSNKEDDSITAIEKSVKIVKDAIFDYIKELPEDKFSGMDINFGGISIWNDVAYFALLGEVGVFWIRDGELADINQLLNDEVEDKTEVKIGSGEINDKDILLISTEYDKKNINIDKVNTVASSTDKGIKEMFAEGIIKTGILIMFESETSIEQELEKENTEAESIVEEENIAQEEDNDQEEELEKDSEKEIIGNKEENPDIMSDLDDNKSEDDDSVKKK